MDVGGAVPAGSEERTDALYRCYSNDRQFIGIVKCHSDRTVCHGSALTDNETVIEVTSVEASAADLPEEFEIGAFLKWSKICLDKIQTKGVGKKRKGRGIKRGSKEGSWEKNTDKKKRERGQEYKSSKTRKVIPA